MEEQPKHTTALDSDQQQIGGLYARALLGSAGGNVEAIVEQFEEVVTGCLDRFPGFEQALASPSIGQEEKEAMLDRIFRGKLDATLLNFFKVLCRRGRVGSLRAIQITLTQLLDEQKGKQRVQVTSAMPLNDEQRESIRGQLKTTFGKESVLEETVDASLLGGIILRIGDQVYDGSVNGKLQQMKQAVLSGVQRSMRDKFESLISS
jgi:F-type H+-transporting ATPase subunit delta